MHAGKALHILLAQPFPLSLPKLQQIQALLLTTSSSHLLPDFISSCSLSRHLPLALRHLLHPPNPDPSLWNRLLLSSSADSDSYPQFLTFYRSMIRHQMPPNGSTFTTLLRSAISLPEPNDAGAALHCQILKLGFGQNVFIQTGLLDFYSKTGFLGLAERVFDEMPVKDVVAHNAMIAALGSKGRAADARKVFDGMVKRNSASWNSMLSCYCKMNYVCEARVLFDGCPVKDVVSWNAMIDGYCKAGELEVARELFDRMGGVRNAVTWNTMIFGYLHRREFGVAISMFLEMQVEGVKPTEVTMVSLLSACAHLGALNLGKWIHAYARNHHLKVDVMLGNALIDMYFKCGSIENALEVFHGMPVKNVFCWNSVIAGLGMHGYGEQAIKMFIEMHRGKGIKPDAVTFVGLLSGCSHSGLVSEGKKFFSQMLGVYGIEPKIEHYGCMVDLLGRASLLEEAVRFIEAMPIKPNCIVWGSLLRACRIHKDTGISGKVTNRLLELDPSDGGNYVFLSNVYASVNRWNDVESCRRIMMERGVRKIPGCSSIEMNGVVHEFVAGDTSHPQFEQIHAFLIEINRGLRNLGYQPGIDSVLHDIEDEEKENAIMYHSEKIAICFWT